MTERLQKLISGAGLCSRRTAEEWIAAGRVTVNGRTARLGDTADGTRDLVCLDGEPLPKPPARSTTVLLYKPRGYVTTLSDERGRPTVAELLPRSLGRLFPVGRLDQFSEGLLLMTNDGDLAHRLTHPRGEVQKTYHLWVSGWQPGASEALGRPIVLDGYRIHRPLVRELWQRGETAQYEITIHEGRNRQIRRMAQAAGLTPTRLKRIAEGSLRLGDLQPGRWRELTEAEQTQLKKDL